jgi:hypothetical protein
MMALLDRPHLNATRGKEIMVTNLTRHIIGISLGLVLFAGPGLSAEPAEVEKFVNARIDIGEMMTNYFAGGERFKEGQRPSPEQMREMGADINTKLSNLLAKHDLTLEEYRKRSAEVFADEAAVKRYLNEHPDLKQRYEALPLDRMGRGGSSTGRGY